MQWIGYLYKIYTLILTVYRIYFNTVIVNPFEKNDNYNTYTYIYILQPYLSSFCDVFRAQK